MDIKIDGLSKEIVKGDTLTLSISGNIPDGAKVQLTLQSDFNKIGPIESQVKSSKADITFSHDQSRDFMSGEYIMTIRSLVDNTVKTLLSYPVKVVDNLNSDSIEEMMMWKTHVKAIDASLGRSGKHEYSFYTIAGRQVNKMPPTDLIKLREYYLKQISAANKKLDVSQGKKNKNVIIHKFGKMY